MRHPLADTFDAFARSGFLAALDDLAAATAARDHAVRCVDEQHSALSALPAGHPALPEETFRLGRLGEAAHAAEMTLRAAHEDFMAFGQRHEGALGGGV